MALSLALLLDFVEKLEEASLDRLQEGPDLILAVATDPVKFLLEAFVGLVGLGANGPIESFSTHGQHFVEVFTKCWDRESTARTWRLVYLVR